LEQRCNMAVKLFDLIEIADDSLIVHTRGGSRGKMNHPDPPKNAPPV